MKKSISYGRVSAEKQRFNTSVEGQHETNTRECHRLGYKVVREFSDVETGTDDNRPGLAAAYEYCKSVANTPQAVKLLSIYHWSRWFRNVEKAFYWRAKFRDIGVDVNAPQYWVDDQDPNSLILYMVNLGMAQGESMNISRRTKRGIYNTLKSGYWPFSAPMGYQRSKIVGENNKRLLESHPDRGPAMSRVFKLIASGHHPAQAYRTCGGSKTLGGFSQFMVSLRNPLYKGFIVAKSDLPGLDEVLVESKNPVLVDPDLFDIVQNILHKEKPNNYQKGSNEFFPAKGVIKCPECGHGCTSSTPLNKLKKKYYYYRCGASSKHYRISRKLAEHSIQIALNDCQIDTKYHSTVLDKMNKKTAVVKEQLNARLRRLASELGKEKKRADKALVLLLDDTINKDQYLKQKNRVEEVEQEAAKVRHALNYQDQVKKIALELLFDLPKLYSAATPESKNLILATLFPSGFIIEKASGVCRTPEINSVLSSIAGGSSGYKNIEIVEESKTAKFVVLGERRDLNPRPLEPQSSALTN